MHAGTKPQVLGVLLVMVGGAIRLQGWSATWMLLLVAAFQLLTAPVSAHMISRVAYRRRHVRRDLLLVDELRTGEARDDDYRGDEPADAPPEQPASAQLTQVERQALVVAAQRGQAVGLPLDLAGLPPAVRTAATATSMSSTAYIGTMPGSVAPPPMPIIGVVPWTCQPSATRPGTATSRARPRRSRGRGRRRAPGGSGRRRRPAADADDAAGAGVCSIQRWP